MLVSETYDMDALLPAYKAAERLSVSRQLFNWWVRSGKLKPVDTHGHPLYRFGDALEVERQTRRSAQSRRKVAVG